MIYWKFTRSGKLSQKYISLIFDIHENNITIIGTKILLSTTVEELESFLVLLQDVEVINNQNSWFTKQALLSEVIKCGYNLTKNYSQSRFIRNLVVGQAVMGRHSGSELDFGVIPDGKAKILIDVTGFKYIEWVIANTGFIGYGSEDKLSCFRSIENFDNSGRYWDLMPAHSVIPKIYNALLDNDKIRTTKFVENVLGWVKL